MYTPTRMCVACRTHRAPQELIRVAYSPDNNMPVIDMNLKNTGRGAYICHDAKCIARARKKNVIERHLKCASDSTLYDRLEALL